MGKFNTIKAYLKALKGVNDQPLSFLKGYEKLTEREIYLLGSLGADIGNGMGEDEFITLMEKFKVK